MAAEYVSVVLLVIAAIFAMLQATIGLAEEAAPPFHFGWACVACLIGAVYLVPTLLTVAHLRP